MERTWTDGCVSVKRCSCDTMCCWSCSLAVSGRPPVGLAADSWLSVLLSHWRNSSNSPWKPSAFTETDSRGMWWKKKKNRILSATWGFYWTECLKWSTCCRAASSSFCRSWVLSRRFSQLWLSWSSWSRRWLASSPGDDSSSSAAALFTVLTVVWWERTSFRKTWGKDGTIASTGWAGESKTFLANHTKQNSLCFWIQ